MDPQTFFLIFLATILVARIALINRRVHSPTIWGIHLHHYMYGLVFIVLAYNARYPIFYPIGLGLFVDEVPQLLASAWRWEDYYSKKFDLWVIGIIFLVALICLI